MRGCSVGRRLAARLGMRRLVVAARSLGGRLVCGRRGRRALALLISMLRLHGSIRLRRRRRWRHRHSCILCLRLRRHIARLSALRSRRHRSCSAISAVRRCGGGSQQLLLQTKVIWRWRVIRLLRLRLVRKEQSARVQPGTLHHCHRALQHALLSRLRSGSTRLGSQPCSALCTQRAQLRRSCCVLLPQRLHLSAGIVAISKREVDFRALRHLSV